MPARARDTLAADELRTSAGAVPGLSLRPGEAEASASSPRAPGVRPERSSRTMSWRRSQSRADAEERRTSAGGPRAALVRSSLPLIDASEARLRADTRYVPERTTRALFRPNLVALAVAAVAASGHPRSRARGGRRAPPSSGAVGPVAARGDADPVGDQRLQVRGHAGWPVFTEDLDRPQAPARKGVRERPHAQSDCGERWVRFKPKRPRLPVVASVADDPRSPDGEGEGEGDGDGDGGEYLPAQPGSHRLGQQDEEELVWPVTRGRGTSRRPSGGARPGSRHAELNQRSSAAGSNRRSAAERP